MSEMNTCGLCKDCEHWEIKHAEEWEYDSITRGQDAEYEPLNREDSIKLYGYEVRFCHSGKIKFYERPEINGGCVVDGSQYKARLITGENFGCVNFEKKK